MPIKAALRKFTHLLYCIDMKNSLLKQIFLLLLIACVWGCASTPTEKPLKTDEDYFNRAMKLYNDRNYFDAIPAFTEFKEKFPLSPYAVLAELYLGDSHFHKEEYVEAIHTFENFRRLHPNNKSVPYSIYMIGLCYYKQILTIDRDPTNAQMAAEQFKQLIELYPDSPYTGLAQFKLSESRRVIAEHEFFIGKFYLQYKNYNGAINRFNTVLKEYPYSIPRDEVIFYLGKANYLSENKQRGEKFLQYLIKRYPNSLYVPEAKVLLGQPVPKQKDKKEQKAETAKEAPDKKKSKKFLLF
jgi:outer membrane protein assembly factor BamD